MPTDTNLNNLIINKLTRSQYNSITTPGTDELYFIIDDPVLSSVTGSSPIVATPTTASGLTTIAISLANGYGDTKNPYASKTKNYVLAAPSSANGVPTFRALVAADIPGITITANATDGYWDLTGTNGTNAVTYSLAPYSSRQSNACFYTGTTAPNGTTRLNYNGYLYATKLYSGETEVLTTTGNAASATYATNVRITDTTPTTGTAYYLTFTDGKGANTNFLLRANAFIKCWIDANGTGGRLVVGDNTHLGALQLKNGTGYQININPPSTLTANRTITLPGRNDCTLVSSDIERRIFVTSTNAVPSGAVAGDIVLVQS